MSQPNTVPAPQIFLAFLRLGCTSFGGPIAHLGYFRGEFVARRKWLADELFANIVALAQTLPGPASSQVVFTIGLLKRGWLGGLAAWTGFTLPSALLLVAFAYAQQLLQGRVPAAIVHNLQLVAVAVVAQAVLNMQRTLAPDRSRASIAFLAAAVVLLGPVRFGTLAAIAGGALCGLGFLHVPTPETQVTHRPQLHEPRIGAVALACFGILLFAAPLLARWSPSIWTSLFDAFYRSGALVFGGGHVVLPLLQSAVVDRGLVSEPTFLAGYGAAQAIPGPLFTLAAYLGIVAAGPLGAIVSLIAIFLPGILLMEGILPFWAELFHLPFIRSALLGINAAVVGVLAGTLYSPLWTSTVRSPVDFAIALAAFVLLVTWKLAPWKVVALTALTGALTALL